MGERAAIVEVTAEVWRDEIVSLRSFGGRMRSVKNGLTIGRNFDCKVWRILRGPDGAVVIGCDEWVGVRVRARYWAQRSWRWLETGSVWVSA